MEYGGGRAKMANDTLDRNQFMNARYNIGLLCATAAMLAAVVFGKKYLCKHQRWEKIATAYVVLFFALIRAGVVNNIKDNYNLNLTNWTTAQQKDTVSLIYLGAFNAGIFV
jgi:hypothetical protein